jgi:hypothetical protein
MKQQSWFRLVSAVAVMTMVAAGILAAAGPAQAYSCSGGHTISVVGDVSRTTITFYPQCSDGKSHWNGTLWDTKCDGRSARLSLVANQAYGYWQWAHAYNAGNGCGSSSTYVGSDRSVIAYAGSSWSVEVAVGACSWSCANFTKGYLHA